MTGAYLFHGNKILMLKRSKDRALASNLWTGIGGHVEANEHNSPEESCLREIFEETGIRRNEIEQFKLRYILMRRSEDEIRQHYIYFGNTSKKNLINTDEGVLHWIDHSKVLNLKMPLTVNHMLKHFLNNPDQKSLFIGSVNQSKMEWSCLAE
ncbi:NUDIX domain-containing protein [Sporosarcina thermotolerans]|uniref:NUDIX domain-containing protein n=1 Tax=Sporosarcina thermotolerans TaxID=633404 RepID=A0AAW9AG70_9BACL|nr:NUDIX domain-containing protein [Sporosarcina thermotolerans]MDW0118648.1 NUDIX domain-containing protein [Sporosarcina thermotolerans]WHT49560.1 NUDIX domain-containing protein [Sporosarcina thermotolerans]